ncbi:MAG: hypothetical protein K8T25_19650 [Planctomycetia bacterium]|nr:hypothetical protein [Planctomycetia bacterium]
MVESPSQAAPLLLPQLSDEFLAELSTSTSELKKPVANHLPTLANATAGKTIFSLSDLSIRILIAALILLAFGVSLLFVPFLKATAIIGAGVMAIGAIMCAAAIAWSFSVMFAINPFKALFIVVLLPLGLVYTPGMSERDRTRFQRCGSLAKRGVLTIFVPFIIIFVVAMCQALLEISHR